MAPPKSILRSLLLLLALLGAWALPARSEFVADPKKLPAPTGYVNDYADIVDEPTISQLEALLKELDQKTTAQVFIVTVPSLGDYDANSFGVGVFENWKPGVKGKDNGAIFLIAPNDRKMFINTGYGLEEILPDARCAAIIGVVRPYFRAGKMSQGVAAGTLAIAAEIAAANHVQLTGNPERAPESRRNRSRSSSASFFITLLIIIIVLNILTRSSRRSRWGGPFIGGGWGGYGGGFGGGGFGGFGGGGGGGGGFSGGGGGSTGGGGAGGSW